MIHLRPGDVYYDHESGCTVRLMTEREKAAILQKCRRGVDQMIRDAKIDALLRRFPSEGTP